MNDTANTPAAIIEDLRHGLMQDFSDTEFPTQVYGFTYEKLILKGPGTAFGFCWEGALNLKADGGLMKLGSAGDYFSVPFEERLEVGALSKGFLALRLGYQGLPMVGGPVEELGRLKYIDGCSDTLLISPPIKGDPCFNLLHFPPGIDQTKHTHPSVRCGLIHGGEGRCHTAFGTEPLLPGKMFILFPEAIHAFSTVGTEGMNLTVYHPETDFGPDHENHPMLNRTIVDGVSAREIDAIRTKEIS